MAYMEKSNRTFEDQRIEFSNRKFQATPYTGIIVWLLIGIAGLILPVKLAVWVLFIGTGSIVYLAMFISKFTGENFLDKQNPKMNLTISLCLPSDKLFRFMPSQFHFL